jgi:predicted 3-demethylubiquinone-9 3-methyltransferase (glyoxalase superfamily)
MIHEIATCLWFDKNAKEAAEFYQSTFSGFEPLSENPMAVNNYRLFDRRFMHLNGGPGYPINPSISFFLNLEDEEEIKRVWAKLIDNGKVLMDSINF